MTGITLELAQQKLDALLAIEVSGNLEVRYGDRSVRRFTPKELRDEIDYWQRWVVRLTDAANGRTGPRVLLANFRTENR